MMNLIWSFLCYEPIQTQNSPGKSSLSLTDYKLKMFLAKTWFLSIPILHHQFYQDLTQELFSLAFHQVYCSHWIPSGYRKNCIKKLYFDSKEMGVWGEPILWLTVSKLFYYWQSTQDCWDGVYPIETHVWEGRRGGRQKWMEGWRERGRKGGRERWRERGTEAKMEGGLKRGKQLSKHKVQKYAWKDSHISWF